jgi:hypothetical protein
MNWDVPHAKGLLNLSQLETEFQQTLQQEGKKVIVDCGAGYRPAQPGDRFDCQTKSAEKQPAQRSRNVAKNHRENTARQPEPRSRQQKRLEAITVTIDPQGNVNWQKVIMTPIQVASAQPSQTPTSPSTSLLKTNSARARENWQRLSVKTQKTLISEPIEG